jgi:N-acyl-D-aspartate/D-glutamate deacylase
MGAALDRPGTAELHRMKNLVAEAMTDGAFGLSNALMMPPGSLATTDELVGLCRVVKRHGGIYSTHIRDEGRAEIDFTSARSGWPHPMIALIGSPWSISNRLRLGISSLCESRPSWCNAVAWMSVT